MKALLSLALCGLLLTTGVVSTQTPSALSQDTDTLEPRVKALEMEIKTLQEENVQLRKLLDGTLAYLEAQASSSRDMLETLNVSETEGFTKGINFRSRETLLSGFRAYWQSVGKGLPKAAKAKAGDKQDANDPVRRR